MRRLGFLITALVLIGVGAQAEPPFIVLPTMNSLTVKLSASSPYIHGTYIPFEIRHHPDGEMLAQGVARAESDPSGLNAFEIIGLHPKLWSPRDPQLYEIELQGIGKVRFGFRVFEVRDREFFLNGRPVFLRGMPINPPRRDLPDAIGKDPEFIRGYLRLVKSAHVNMIRTDTEPWLDACDEVGLLVFQGSYGGVLGGKPSSFEQARQPYRDIVMNLANHPSVVIYVLTNEVDYRGNDNLEVLSRVREDLRLLDPTRPVLGNAGFGKGGPGEIYDVHPYQGWYAGSLCDWYRLSRYLAAADKAGKPLTLTECVAAYTSDAGVFETMSKQLATMLRWAGPEADQRKAALGYQAELTRQLVEISRRMRTRESGIAGVMPFTYFLGWANAKKARDIIVKPAFVALRESFQPVLISAECWRRNVYSGDHLKMRLCVANDDDAGRGLRPSITRVTVVSSQGRLIASGEARFPAVPCYSNAWADLSIPIPKATRRGVYDVRLTLFENDRRASDNSFSIRVAPRAWTRTRGTGVALFDPRGMTAKALLRLGVQVRRVSKLTSMPDRGVLVIGEGALTGRTRPLKSAVMAFVDRGGRILCLRQDLKDWKSDWLPASFVPEQGQFARPLTYIHPVGGNAAIFDGLSSADLRFWNEIGRDHDGSPKIGPVLGPLKPAGVSDLRNSRIWAVCDQIMRGVALAEVFHGRGSVILSQFQCVDRVDRDPISAKLLANLVTYAASPGHPSRVDLSRPVRWDLAAYRIGAFAAPVQGFLPHSKTYRHRDESKGMLGADHRIDGVTLIGAYTHGRSGRIEPVPDPGVEGWGIVYGLLSKPAKQFVLRVRNPSDVPARIRVLLDDREIGRAVVPAGVETLLRWRVARKPGLVKLEMRGNQSLVVLGSRFD